MVKIKLLMGCALWGGVVALPAQDLLYVHLYHQPQQTYDLSTLKGITFPDGQVSLNKLNGTSSLYTVSAIKKIDFELEDIVTVLDAESTSLEAVSLYPNPLKGDLLTIRSELVVAQELLVELLNAHGGVEKHIIVQSSVGSNETTCDLEGLHAGVYFWRITTENQVQTGKLIKY